jgi:hypothetical protein
VAIDGRLQVAPEQQPLGQEVRQPLQLPLVHASPPGQVSQALPPVPQEAALSPGRQTSPAQQPSGHDVPSQTQVLPTHRWPIAHAALAPQRQAPAAEQLSARASHTAHVEPASPQVSKERVAQVAPWQQPLGHEVASQMHRPAAQRWPPAQAAPAPQAHAPVGPQRLALLASHASQADPPIPQVVSDGASQTPP